MTDYLQNKNMYIDLMNQYGGWQCQRCTEKNTTTETNCVLCGKSYSPIIRVQFDDVMIGVKYDTCDDVHNKNTACLFVPRDFYWITNYFTAKHPFVTVFTNLSDGQGITSDVIKMLSNIPQYLGKKIYMIAVPSKLAEKFTNLTEHDDVDLMRVSEWKDGDAEKEEDAEEVEDVEKEEDAEEVEDASPATWYIYAHTATPNEQLDAVQTFHEPPLVVQSQIDEYYESCKDSVEWIGETYITPTEDGTMAVALPYDEKTTTTAWIFGNCGGDERNTVVTDKRLPKNLLEMLVGTQAHILHMDVKCPERGEVCDCKFLVGVTIG